MIELNLANLKNMLWKIYEEPSGHRFVIFYQLEENKTTQATKQLEENTSVSYTVRGIDINTTVESGTLALFHLAITDLEAFQNQFVEIPKEEEAQYSQMVTEIVHEEYRDRVQELKNIGSLKNGMGLLNARIRKQIKEEGVSGVSTVQGNISKFIQLVLKDDNGKPIVLDHDQLKQVGGAVQDVIASNAAKDISDPNEVEKIRNQMIYRILEELPDSIRADYVKVSSQEVISQIENYRFASDDDDSDELHS